MKTRFNIIELKMLQKIVEKELIENDEAHESIQEIAFLYEKITRMHQVEVDKMRTIKSQKCKMNKKTKYAKNPNVPEAEKKKFIKLLKILIKEIKADTTGSEYNYTENIESIIYNIDSVSKEISYTFTIVKNFVKDK